LFYRVLRVLPKASLSNIYYFVVKWGVTSHRC